MVSDRRPEKLHNIEHFDGHFINRNSANFSGLPVGKLYLQTQT
jgi:hypothetical protein